MKIVLPLAAVSMLIGVAVASYPTQSLALPDCQALYQECLADGINPATCQSEFEKCECIGHTCTRQDAHLNALKSRENH